MKQLDVYYRALLQYREQTQQNKQCVSDSRAVIKANADLDKIVLTRKHCIIEEDWVDTIEEGLKYIAKAIAEERQFIYSNGETVPIEKVKNVSKDSVVHLAKHSNLITREMPGEDVIPDQLYTVEKLNDYAVYENKFLYMLLCYLRDFITIRYNKILELSNTYNGTMTMNKVVKTATRTMNYSVDFSEIKRDDDYLKETNQAKDIINRIDLLLKTVLAFFNTPLMQVVSKAPMIKPPITKTNVLKMNNNFKQAMNLYGYIVAYEGDGYRVETEIKEISPFTDTIAEEMSETILLSSFITYEHSLGIESVLKHEYELEEQRRKEKALQEFREKLEAARLRVQKSEMSMEEYILMLEKHVRALEKKAKELDQVKQELEETKALLEQTTKENIELKENLERTINELEAEKLRYITDMAALKLAHEEEIKNLVTEYEDKITEIISTHENEIRELNEKHENEINELNEQHVNEINMLNEAHENEISALNEQHENEINTLNEAHENEINTLNESHENEINALNEQHSNELLARDNQIAMLTQAMANEKAKYEAEILRKDTEYTKNINSLTTKNTELSAQLQDEIKEKRYLKAQYLALKQETGKLTSEDDHVTQVKFDELEHTYEVFKKFYKNEWKKAKRYIRRDILKIFKRKKKGDTETVEETPSIEPTSQADTPRVEQTLPEAQAITQERVETAQATTPIAQNEETAQATTPIMQNEETTQSESVEVAQECTTSEQETVNTPDQKEIPPTEEENPPAEN
jgi:hypothetical protein